MASGLHANHQPKQQYGRREGAVFMIPAFFQIHPVKDIPVAAEAMVGPALGERFFGFGFGAGVSVDLSLAESYHVGAAARWLQLGGEGRSADYSTTYSVGGPAVLLTLSYYL